MLAEKTIKNDQFTPFQMNDSNNNALWAKGCGTDRQGAGKNGNASTARPEKETKMHNTPER